MHMQNPEWNWSVSVHHPQESRALKLRELYCHALLSLFLHAWRSCSYTSPEDRILFKINSGDVPVVSYRWMLSLILAALTCAHQQIV